MEAIQIMELGNGVLFILGYGTMEASSIVDINQINILTKKIKYNKNL